MRATDFLQKEAEQEELGGEIYSPDWHCFCCNDTGFIRPHDFYEGDLLKRISKRNIGIACTCRKGSERGDEVARFDEVNFDSCQRVHLKYMQAWADSIRDKVAIARQTKEALAMLSLDMPYSRPQSTRLSNAEIAEIEATLAPVAMPVSNQNETAIKTHLPATIADEEDTPF